MKNQLKKITSILIVCAMLVAMLACGCTEQAKTPNISVVFKDGNKILGSISTPAGSVVTGYEKFETREGFEFLGWYETPSFLENSKKDLKTAVFNEDTTLFGSFKNLAVKEDTRAWTIVGTGKGAALALSNWNNGCDDALVSFTKTENPNEFTLTVDLFDGDQFQVIHDYDWNDQRGYGWFKGLDEAQFENGGGLSGSDKSSNVNVVMDGNYTITIVTDPENPAMDEFTIVRNGDPKGDAIEKDEEPFVISESTQVLVKGSWVADWSENKELTRKEGENRFSIEMELEAGTELYFMIWDDGADTGLGLKGENVTDDASKALLEENNNVKVAEAGTYTFTVDLDANTITVTK